MYGLQMGYTYYYNIKNTDQDGYRLITVDGGNLSGTRKPLVKVDIGYGDRLYWSYTNEYGQVIKVTADTLTLQDEENEEVDNDGRYYPDEAKVKGTEEPTYDEGHIIADSLGGVANAYNITPEAFSLNRYGDKAYMEDSIRKALQAGLLVTNFEAVIIYPDNKTMIPSKYKYTYYIDGRYIVDEFENKN